MQRKNFSKVRESSFAPDWWGGARGVSVNSLPRHYDRSVGSLAGGKLILECFVVAEKRGFEKLED